MLGIRQTIHAARLLLPLLAAGSTVFFSCENDLRDVDKVANIRDEENVNISREVTVTYSDSAVVKAELTAAELREYPDSIGLYEFQKGVQIRFFEPDGSEARRIRADYAIQRNYEGLTEFRKNVVITMADGSVIKTEELFHDENKQIYYNTVPISFDMKDGRGAFQASSFTSDTDLRDVKGESVTGFIIPNEEHMPAFGR